MTGTDAEGCVKFANAVFAVLVGFVYSVLLGEIWAGDVRIVTLLIAGLVIDVLFLAANFLPLPIPPHLGPPFGVGIITSFAMPWINMQISRETMLIPGPVFAFVAGMIVQGGVGSRSGSMAY